MADRSSMGEGEVLTLWMLMTTYSGLTYGWQIQYGWGRGADTVDANDYLLRPDVWLTDPVWVREISSKTIRMFFVFLQVLLQKQANLDTGGHQRKQNLSLK